MKQVDDAGATGALDDPFEPTMGNDAGAPGEINELFEPTAPPPSTDPSIVREMNRLERRIEVLEARPEWPRITPAHRWLVGLLALLFVLFVWPTPYAYFNRDVQQYRRNRFTGGIERYDARRWQPWP